MAYLHAALTADEFKRIVAAGAPYPAWLTEALARIARSEMPCIKCPYFHGYNRCAGCVLPNHYPPQDPRYTDAERADLIQRHVKATGGSFTPTERSDAISDDDRKWAQPWK
jgi:hypothetical protein